MGKHHRKKSGKRRHAHHNPSNDLPSFGQLDREFALRFSNPHYALLSLKRDYALALVMGSSESKGNIRYLFMLSLMSPFVYPEDAVQKAHDRFQKLEASHGKPFPALGMLQQVFEFHADKLDLRQDALYGRHAPGMTKYKRRHTRHTHSAPGNDNS